MPFLDSTPDLTRTIITQENLIGARIYFKRLISLLDPKWLTKPKGYLRLAWDNDGESGVTFLVDLALHLLVVEKAITVRSRTIFEDKVIQLLRINDEKDFNNLVSEFRVLSFFAQKTNPIELDPLVPQNKLKSSERPKTPDFSIQLSSERILLEITVFYFQPFIICKNDIDQTFRFIKQDFFKNNIRRIFTLNLPLSYKWSQVKNFIQSTVLPNVKEAASGKDSITVNEKQISVAWRELPHIQCDLSKHPHPSTIIFPNDDYATFSSPGGLGMWWRQGVGYNNNYSWFGIKKTSAIAFETIIQPEDVTELIIKSIRNTLDRKREQLRSKDTQILVFVNSHHELTTPEIIGMVQKRIWANPQYAWLSAILIYIPRTGFVKNDKPAHMYSLINPNAACSGKAFNEFMSINFKEIH